MGTTQKSAPAVAVAVDGNGRGRGALRYAIEEARTRGSEIRMIHVLNDHGSTGHEVMEPDMTQACAAAPDLRFDWRFVRGERADALIAAADGCSVLVLGRWAGQGPGLSAIGSVTSDVAARAGLPVTIVPADWQAREHGHIVVGIKAAAHAGELLAHAFSAASTRHAALHVVHVRTNPADRHTTESQMLRGLVRAWAAAYPGVEVETSFVHGRPAHVLIEAAADSDVLMAARHHRDLRHLVRLGPVAREIMGTSRSVTEVVPLTGERTTAPLVLERSGTILKG